MLADVELKPVFLGTGWRALRAFRDRTEQSAKAADRSGRRLSDERAEADLALASDGFRDVPVVLQKSAEIELSAA